MGIYAFKPAFRRLLAPAQRPLMRLRPNTISALAVVCAALAAACLWRAPDAPWLYLVAPGLFLLRIAFNALDGMVAQARGLASPRGELVNEFSDRVNDVLILLGLAASGVADLRILAGATVAVLLVSYLGVLPRAAGLSRRYDGPAGKADRMALLGAASLAAGVPWVRDRFGADDVFDAALLLLLVLALLTLAVRWSRAWREAA